MKPSKEEYLRGLQTIIEEEQQKIKVIDENVQKMIDKIQYQASRQKNEHLSMILAAKEEMQKITQEPQTA